MRTIHPSLALSAALLFALAGCQKQPAAAAAPTDQQITTSVQSKLQAESALAGQNIQVAVSNGVVTLSGNASDPASRALAGNDAGSIAGVKTVVNNLDVQPSAPPETAAAQPAPAPAPPPETAPSARERRREERARARHHQAKDNTQPTDMAENTPPPPPPASTPAPEQTPAAPPPPPQPVTHTYTFPAGTTVPIRLTDSLSSANAQANQSFHGTMAADLVRNGVIVIPQGTPVIGRVVEAKDASHFKGSSLLSLELTRVNLRGQQIAVYTSAYSKEGAARGKNTAEKAGGGALLGTLIGALAGGGKGAAIGAIAGAGAGTGINAATRGQQVQLGPETLINFSLQSPLSVIVTHTPGSPEPVNRGPYEPTLQERSQPQPPQ